MIKEKLKLFSLKLKKNFPLVILSSVVLLLTVIFVVQFVSREKFIYFYDYSTYQIFYSELGDKFLHRPLKALDSISVSVRKAEYNNSGVIALMPFYFIFGAGRIAYICSVAVTYAFPVILFFPFVIRKLLDFNDRENRLEKTMFFAVGIILPGLLPQFWIPVLFGYIDVAGVGLIFLILYLFFQKNIGEQSWKRLIYIGLLLSALVILRRWYAYWAVGFFAAAAVGALWNFISREKDFGRLKNSLARIFAVGSISVLTFFIFSSKIAFKMLQTDYRDEYSAFRSSENIFQAFEKLYSYFGLIFTLISATGLVVMLIKKDLRPPGIFLSVLFFVTFFLFTRTQDIDRHHYYWVISILIIFSAVSVFEIFRKLQKTWQKLLFIVLLTAICAANFSIVFFPSAESALQPISFALPQIRYYPPVRNDLEQLHQLMLTLNLLTENSDKKIYVLSSSMRAGGGVVRNAADQFEPELKKMKDKVLQTFELDKRDGFPFQLYEADFIVITDPLIANFSPEEEKIVTIPAGQITGGRNIGRAYVKLPYEFFLDGGEKVYIYQKQRNLTPEELEKMSGIFTGFYPDRREKFEISDEQLKKYSEN